MANTTLLIPTVEMVVYQENNNWFSRTFAGAYTYSGNEESCRKVFKNLQSNFPDGNYDLGDNVCESGVKSRTMLEYEKAVLLPSVKL